MNPPRHLAAAQYLRMSTDQQDLSIDLQRDAIARYAASQGLAIVATYQDEAKSGLRIANRKGMRQLVADVTHPQCAYATVLVYDVSRWGRFQNTDASAYWDYHCRLHRVKVVYVAELFDQDAGPFAALLKSMKRAMAAEYSRELGVKTRAGAVRVIQQGFSAGGGPGLGLVRQAVTRDGAIRLTLADGERKGVQSDRVRLVPGPSEEVALVRRIFALYATTDMGVAALARQLDAEGFRTRSGGRINQYMLHGLLQHETFIGNYVWAKRPVSPEGQRRAPPGRQVRANGVIEPIIDMELWQQVQAKHNLRGAPRRNAQRLLDDLGAALKRHPELTEPDLQAWGCASSQAYLNAFGSLEAAYALVGRDPRAVQQVAIRRQKRGSALSEEMLARAAQSLREQGFALTIHLRRKTISIDDGACIQVRAAYLRGHCKEPTWLIPRRRQTMSDYRLLFLLQDDTDREGTMILLPEEVRWTFPILLRPAHLPDWSEFVLPSLTELGCRTKGRVVNNKELNLLQLLKGSSLTSPPVLPAERQAWLEFTRWCRALPVPSANDIATRLAELTAAGNFFALRLASKQSGRPGKPGP
jgi:DNA invertase Pin-like site-specific DNA recombinase